MFLTKENFLFNDLLKSITEFLQGKPGSVFLFNRFVVTTLLPSKSFFMSNSTITTHADATLQTLKHELKSGSSTGAAQSISSWITSLSTVTGHPDLKTIAINLEKLKVALHDNKTAEISTLMATLGHDTIKAAASAHEDEKPKIKALGEMLLESSKEQHKHSGK